MSTPTQHEKAAFEWLRHLALTGNPHAQTAIKAWHLAHNQRAELAATAEVLQLTERMRSEVKR